MTFERAMVILFTKVAQTVIAERFTHTFFDNDGNRVRKVFAYLFSVFIAIFVNLFFHKPIFNFLSIFLGLSAIALSYNGTIKRKCIFVFYIFKSVRDLIFKFISYLCPLILRGIIEIV